MASGSSSDSDAQPTSPHNVELEDLGDKKNNVPLEEDIMQLARLGELRAIQKLFESGKYDATYKDEQGITALHVCGEPDLPGEQADRCSGLQLIITMLYAIS